MTRKRTPFKLEHMVLPDLGLTQEDFDILANLGDTARAAAVQDYKDWPEDAYIMLDREVDRAQGTPFRTIEHPEDMHQYQFNPYWNMED